MSQNQPDPLAALREVTPADLIEIPGAAPAKATRILAAIELGERASLCCPADGTVIDSPVAAAATLSQDLMWQNREGFAVLLLDVKNKFLGTKVITIGTGTETLASPRDIFEKSFVTVQHGR